MSKTNDTKLGPTTQVRELRDDELENVSGGEIKDFAGTYVRFAGDGLGAAHSHTLFDSSGDWAW